MKTIQRGEVHKIDINDLKVGIQDVLDAMVDVRPSAMREIFLEMPKVQTNHPFSDITDLPRRLGVNWLTN